MSGGIAGDATIGVGLGQAAIEECLLLLREGAILAQQKLKERDHVEQLFTEEGAILFGIKAFLARLRVLICGVEIERIKLQRSRRETYVLAVDTLTEVLILRFGVDDEHISHRQQAT